MSQEISVKNRSVDEKIILEMREKAAEAKFNAYVGQSNFPIGVAILMRNGDIVTGFNIETSSYSLTICGERVAISSALSQGYKPQDIDKILVIGDVDSPISPCGACREFMSDFINDNVDIILCGKNDSIIITSIGKLLPHRFTEQFLEHSS
jgi:cytidine deaminase